jgi:energy-coupling factor transport system ATP-binding protein
MMNMMEKLHKKGHTILAITHNMRLAAEYADRVIVFANGQVVLDGKPEEVFYQQEILESAFVTPPDSVLIASRLRQSEWTKYPVTVKDIQLLFTDNGDEN